MIDKLKQLHADIDARVRTIRAHRPDWPCGKGCDGCCRRLADLPRVSSAEWLLLKQGLVELPAARLGVIEREMAALAGQTSPYVCPFLDHTTGACPIYAQRPVACRTYGFYVQHKLGLYCGDIESRVADGAMADVVWGNHDPIDHQLAELGEGRTLVQWFEADWRPKGD